MEVASDVSETDQYIKPGFFLSKLVNPAISKLRMAPTLAVRGRTSGQWRTVPVNVLELHGSRYLVAPRGATHWARNLREAGGGELRKGAKVERFNAAELANDEKPPVIEAYREHWGRATRKQWDALPNPGDHPVFRIEPKPRLETSTARPCAPLASRRTFIRRSKKRILGKGVKAYA